VLVVPLSPSPSPSGGEGNISGEKMGDYGGDHLRQIFFHVFCGEPHDSIAACFEECLPLGVSFLLTAVNGAVDLHDEAMGGTEEIDHEGANRLLTAEMDAELVPTGAVHSHHSLGVGPLRKSRAPSTIRRRRPAGMVILSPFTVSPQPPPPRGGRGSSFEHPYASTLGRDGGGSVAR